jgi:hypothetical protein
MVGWLKESLTYKLLYIMVVHCGSLELDLLMASVGASEDRVSGRGV